MILGREDQFVLVNKQNSYSNHNGAASKNKFHFIKYMANFTHCTKTEYIVTHLRPNIIYEPNHSDQKNTINKIVA